MRRSRGYSNFLEIEKIIDENAISDKSTREQVQEDIKAEILRRESKIKSQITIGYSIMISLLFMVSYVILIYVLYNVFEVEVELIKNELLDSKDRSFNAKTIAALVAGTITQVGLAFYAVTKYIFIKDKAKK